MSKGESFSRIAALTIHERPDAIPGQIVRPATPELATTMTALRTTWAVAASWALVSGTAGSGAMLPFGIVLRRMGYSVNVYGQLMANALFGHPPPWVLVAQHFVIGWSLALPPLRLFGWLERFPRIFVGAAYGFIAWLALNSLALPIVFGRPTPWQLGSAAIWPSLLVHLVYGVSMWFSACGLRSTYVKRFTERARA